MIYKVLVISAIMTIGMVGHLFARPLPAVADMAAESMLSHDSAVCKGQLPNGLTYYVRHNDQTPGQADFYLAVRAGSILEEPDQRGLAHFLEHIAFNGSQHFPGGNGEERSIRGWCEHNGIKFGSDLNAYTSIDETVYNIANAPVSRQGVADTCLLIMRDIAGSLLIDSLEVERERGVIHEEWRARRSRFATTRLMEEAMPVIYAGTRYVDCLPIGNMQVVDTCSHTRLRDYYSRWYRPDLQGVIVVGDVNVDSTVAMIQQLFGTLTMPVDPVERVYYPIGDNERTIFFVRADDEQPTLNFSLYMKRDAEPRESRNTLQAYTDGYKSRLAMFILRQRLAQLTKEATPRLMSVSVRDNAFYVTPAKDAFALNIGLLPDNPRAGIDAAIEIVEKARRFGFTDSELDHAKIQHALSIEHKLETGDKTRNAEYVRIILNGFLNDAPAMSIADEAALIAALNESITLDDINQTIKEIITDTNQVCLLFGPTKYDGIPYKMPTETILNQWIANAQSAEYTDDARPLEVDPTFMSTLPVPGTIVATANAGNGYTDYLLSNGITVSVRPSDLEPNRLTLLLTRSGGRSLYTDEDDTNLRLLGTVVRESGAADFDYLTLEKKRRGKALRVVPFIDDEEEGVKGVCAASDLKTWLEVAYLYLTAPRRDDAIFNNIINRQKALLKNRDANPNVIYNDSLRVAVYGRQNATRPFTVDRLDEADINRIYQIYNERFANLAGMTLIITGDVRQDELDDLLCQYVASLPADVVPAYNPAIGSNLLDILPGNREVTFSADMKTPSTMTNVIYSAPIAYNPMNDMTMDMLAQLMRAIFTETIREDEGGTYGVSVSGSCWKYPTEGASITVNFRCDPDKFDRLLPIVDREFERMASDGPTDRQLARVREYLLKNYDRAVLTNGWWEYVRHHQLHEGVDFNTGYRDRVKSITPADIRQFCRDLLDANNHIQVTMNPVNNQK